MKKKIIYIEQKIKKKDILSIWHTKKDNTKEHIRITKTISVKTIIKNIEDRD